MLKIYLIRHGQTPGNKLKPYIGTTDEQLSQEGREFLEKLSYPMPESLYVSPLLRCVETAEFFFRKKNSALSRNFQNAISENLKIRITRNFREMTIIRSGSTVTECFLSREERAEKTLSTEA